MLDLNLPIINIIDYDFARVDNFLYYCLQGKKIVEWNPALCTVELESKKIINNNSLLEFLKEQYFNTSNNSDENEKYIVLKECSSLIEGKSNDSESCKIVTLLLMMAQKHLYHNTETDCISPTSRFNFNVTIILVSTDFNIPEPLKKYVSDFDMGIPDEEEIKEIIKYHINCNKVINQLDEDSIISFSSILRGLTAFDIDRTLDMTMYKNGSIDYSDISAVELYKKNIVKQSGVLELITIDTNQTIDKIGGGEGLKTYLKEVSNIIKNISEARKFGVNVPKGVFLAGMPGCGKSQCAKAASLLFNLPLLKMDMGQLMGKYVGESESNMRKALKVAESAAPCILFIDEIEKAFSGIDSDNNGVMRRMFGHFLSWLQDKKSIVYVIATANKLNNLPPELKRKGRFDDIFCIDLPNKKERKEIFTIYLKSKGFWNEDIDLNTLIGECKGFSGADIESVVNEAIKKMFLINLSAKPDEKIDMNTDLLLKTIKGTTCISDTCGDQIEQMKNDFIENQFLSAVTGKPMTPDNIILDEEHEWEFPDSEYKGRILRSRKKNRKKGFEERILAIDDIQGLIKKEK